MPLYRQKWGASFEPLTSFITANIRFFCKTAKSKPFFCTKEAHFPSFQAHFLEKVAYYSSFCRCSSSSSFSRYSSFSRESSPIALARATLVVASRKGLRPLTSNRDIACHSEHRTGIDQTLSEKPQHAFMYRATRWTPKAHHHQQRAHCEHRHCAPFLKLPFR